MGLMDGFIPEYEYHDDDDPYRAEFGVGQCLWCGLYFQKMHPSDNCCEPCFNEKEGDDANL